MTMKIKSWTNNEAECRPTMVVSIVEEVQCGCFIAEGVIVSIDENKKQLEIKYLGLTQEAGDYTVKHDIDDCTMLHCPFVAGDKVVWRNMTGIIVGFVDNDGAEAITGSPELILEQIFVFEARGRRSLAKESELTHANPDLRDSPEYAP